jgi:hypothetical protein
MSASSRPARYALHLTGALLALLLCGAVSAPRAEALSFAPKVDYVTGMAPWNAAVADFSGDHVQDLAVATDANTVSVLLGNGDGTFAAKTDFGTGALPTVAVGDLNGDGAQDLATANWGANTVSVLLGNGDGTFQPKIDFATGSSPEELAVGDFNNDGKADLVTANSSANSTRFSSVSVLLGNGDGTFQAKTDYQIGDNQSTYSVAVGDFNNDGKADLATANSGTSTASVLLGNGDGTFKPKTDSSTGFAPMEVAVGDFNGDGKADLATANDSFPSGTVSVLLGNGNGTFAAKTDFAAGVGPNWVAVGDFDGNGKVDLVTANQYDNTASVLLGNGNGTFAAKMDLGTGSGPTSVNVGDFNHDGRVDLVTANHDTNTVSVLLNTTGDNVPPKLGAVSVPFDPVAAGTQVSASVPFSDAGVLDTHAAVWDWGDSTTSPGTVSEMGGAGTVSGSHVYATPGVYPVTVTLTDNGGASDSAVSEEYVVVYDPAFGFVTGGGWIDSPAGAYKAEPALAAKASFGFVSKYFKKATYPRGSTRFTLHGCFEFQAAACDSLVVAGAIAQYKGSGTLNGGQGYSFLLSALDGQAPRGGGVDKFRIKIWNTKTGTLVYDTQSGAADSAPPTTLLGGGGIVIHS